MIDNTDSKTSKQNVNTPLRWSYADHAVEARKLRGDTEKEWIAERNAQFKKLSKKVGMEGCPTKFGCQDTLLISFIKVPQ